MEIAAQLRMILEHDPEHSLGKCFRHLPLMQRADKSTTSNSILDGGQSPVMKRLWVSGMSL